MNWIKLSEALMRGETVKFRPSGNSMTPKIKSRQLVTVAPVSIANLKIGDIVFTKVKGNYYLHLVKSINEDKVLIGNNHGKINGWTNKIYGIVINVE